jgi:PhoPQ-activated pathogenicity-related protein
VTLALVVLRLAAIPIVMPALNLVPNFNHVYRLYGGWSFALDDYIHEGLMGFLNLPQWKLIDDVVDPYTYIKRYTMPKLIIAATGDEFFAPDSERWWWADLPGPKLLSMVANAEHSLASGIIDVATAIAAFVHLNVENKPLPDYSWTLTRSNGTAVSGHPAHIEVNVGAASRPYLKSVQSWKATTISTTKVFCVALAACAYVQSASCFLFSATFV